MSAKSVRITFFTVLTCSRPKLELEPNWWPAETLSRDPRFVLKITNPGYSDWEADFTEAAFREMNEGFRSRAYEGVYRYPGWQKVIAPKMQLIDAALAGGLGEIAYVRVLVFEWESGLD
jgi:hypothetical protein